MSVRKAHKKTSKKSVRVARNLSRDDLAEELDLHPDSIKRHHSRENKPPHDRKGQMCLYNAGEYQAWMDDEGLTGERGRQSQDSPDLEAARLRKENALASKYELQVAKERAELVPVDEIKAWIGQRVTATKNRLIGLGAAITPHLEGRDAAERQTIIDTRINEILNELART